MEFVSEIPMEVKTKSQAPPTKRPKPGPLSVQVNRQKYLAQRGELSNGGTSSGDASPRNSDDGLAKVGSEKGAFVQNEKDGPPLELDVKQIMRDLKQLQVRLI